jgi:hypothetical protein
MAHQDIAGFSIPAHQILRQPFVVDNLILYFRAKGRPPENPVDIGLSI